MFAQRKSRRLVALQMSGASPALPAEQTSIVTSVTFFYLKSARLSLRRHQVFQYVC